MYTFSGNPKIIRDDDGVARIKVKDFDGIESKSFFGLSYGKLKAVW